MKITPLLFACFVFGLAVSAHASVDKGVQSLGNDTYSVTRQASTGFTRDTDPLKAEALDEAKTFCAGKHKEMKVISVKTSKPRIMFSDYAKATVVFKALDANDPELNAPVVESNGATMSAPAPAPRITSTDVLYNDLTKLDDLRKRGILTDEEFQAQKKKILDRTN